MAELKRHDVVLRGKTPQGTHITLRPLTENDWDTLARWNSDPEVLYYAEGDHVTARTLEDVQQIYRSVSHNAFCFIIEADGTPVGECWLQKMNLDRITQTHPDLDCRRIDIMIGEKLYCGQGIGSKAIYLLTEFAFMKENADVIFGCGIADYNIRSLRAFQKVGYETVSKIIQVPGRKANCIYDLALSKEKFYKKTREDN